MTADIFEAPSPESELVVALDGFEGPLDLLLALARTEKLDIASMSMLALADQYLAFISAAKALRLEIAGDYLVMAAWLAFLKSKLLLPPEAKRQDDGPDGRELALALAHRLARLAAMQRAMNSIAERPQLGRESFARGMPEGTAITRTHAYWASAYELLKAYAEQRRREATRSVAWGGRTVWSIKQARDRLRTLATELGLPPNGFASLDIYLAEYCGTAEIDRTARASSFGATLELTREGHMELRQAGHFAPLMLRWLDAAMDVQSVPDARRRAVGE